MSESKKAVPQPEEDNPGYCLGYDLSTPEGIKAAQEALRKLRNALNALVRAIAVKQGLKRQAKQGAKP